MKNRATSILLTGALGLGGMATGLVVAPAIAQAQTSDTSTAEAVSERVSRVADALSGLVSDGSITQAQADRVATTLADELPRRGGRGGRNLGAAAEVIGISENELRTALAGGRSLAQVAEAQGVERQALIDALVAAASEHLDEEVAEGDLTQAEADEREAELTEGVTQKVDRVRLHGLGDRGASDAADAEGTTIG